LSDYFLPDKIYLAGCAFWLKYPLYMVGVKRGVSAVVTPRRDYGEQAGRKAQVKWSIGQLGN
jgi:hypothetical protein